MNDAAARTAVRDLLIAHIPGLTPDNTLAAWDNRVPPPPGDYCLISVISRVRLSTNIASWSPDTETLSLTQAVNLTLQADFRGGLAQEWAEALSTLWPSQIAADLLTPHGCQPLYAGDPRNLTAAEAEGRFEPRWLIELSAAATTRFAATLDYFEDVDLHTYPQL